MRIQIPASEISEALKTGKVWAVSDGRTKEFEVKSFTEGPFAVTGENGIGIPIALSLKRISEDFGFTFEKEESPTVAEWVTWACKYTYCTVHHDISVDKCGFCGTLRPPLPPKQGDSLL